jgi:protein CpxP
MYRFRLISLATASAMGAAVIAGTFAPAIAQTAPSKPAAAAAATSAKPDTVEDRITTLKTALKITPDQEAKWTAVATAMRDNAAAMNKLVTAKRAVAPESVTAVDDLKTYQEFTQAHLDGLKNLSVAFVALYDTMPADQKKNADQVFMQTGPAKAK